MESAWKLGRRPALDGIRGVAILLVVACHAGQGLTGAGVEGVMLFFTLSGFLITSLLLEEHEHGPVRLRQFYLRRARRLLPALGVLLVVVLVAGSWLPTGVTPGTAAAIVFYVTNWYAVAHPALNALSHTWSLAIEEQFYLLWPLVLMAVARRGRLLRTAVAGAVVAFAAMAWGLATGHDESLGRADVGAAALLVGCALATWMHRRPEGPSRSRVVLLGLAALVPFVVAWHGWPARLALQVVTPLAAALMIWASAQGEGVALLSGRVLGWVGRRSYAIYLWHFPILWVGAEELGTGVLRVSLEVAAAFAVAELSWRLVEAPFLRRRPARKTTPSLAVTH